MESIASSACLPILSKLIDDLYDFVSDKITLKITKNKIHKKIPQLIDRINNIRFVKTLWQVDRAVDIDSFYCDSHVLIPTKRGGDSKRTKVLSVSDFGTHRNIVIRGIAGQGKSIFLRYLCIKEFEAGQRIPIFVELRRIQANETLLDHISRFFNILDLPIDRDLFTILSKSGKFLFFLDGFDEISENMKPIILNEVEYLASTSSDCQFIITSRPNSPIEMSSMFDVVVLDDLKGDEYKNVLTKLTDSTEYANTLIDKVQAHKSAVQYLLCTPLLVTLLIISYKSFQKIPEQLADFYESIFYVLLQRHDGTKPGFFRQRRCSINDNQYREIFDALCYQAKKTGQTSFTYQTIYEVVNRAMSLLDIKEDPDKYLKDVVTVTCLILLEGNEYRFIHRSVQEYYSSCFIKSRPENKLTSFYTACIDYSTWLQWDQELSFLSEIDKYRYYKYFLIPLCQKWLPPDTRDQLISGRPLITLTGTRHILDGFYVGWDLNESGTVYGSLLGHTNLNQIMNVNIIFDLINLDYSELDSKIQKGKIVVSDDLLKKQIGPKYEKEEYARVIIAFEQIIDEGFLIEELQSFAEKVLNHVYDLWEEAHSYITRQDSFDIVSDIIS